MIINNVKRIRSLENYTKHIADGERFYIGLEITEYTESILRKIGFKKLIPGEALVPGIQGPISRFNALGKEIPQRNLPKETHYRQSYWTWKQWDGTENSKIVDIPYKKYPRIQVMPPSDELLIVKKNGKKLLIVSGIVTKGQTDNEVIIHKINLLLELFKEAVILKEDLHLYQIPKLVRMNWEILPQGEKPFKSNHLRGFLDKVSIQKKPVILNRLELVEKYNPDTIAVGVNGYKGYVIYGFKALNLYIFESAFYGNATYVFEGDWEKVSKLTKAEIINSNLYKFRIIHQSGWEKEIGMVMKSYNN